ncbi:hypothetical protein [Photobacterium sp. 1_MG-2023]|uniref:hypothetical protein n=1 Tax=Photobacterium sp. 1_MG-2023 TaxID=3062646 RepID=UPI0026E23219|nr:hypothetical protein [Photobacterium sp. 1_MG-2023]MDO6706751.1 hypothetical protein [Photobacterium sp. 1_MG-2023]
MTQLSTTGGFSLTPQSLEEAMRMAELMANSEMVPKDYQGKPGNVLVAVQMGAELGLKPVQSLQNIAVVNGRPSIWGDGLRALIMSAPDLVDIKDEFENNTMKASCTITRQINGNHVQFLGEFTKEDAENAGLWGRNTWKSYPKKMLEWRAFGFAARKAYADRLRGISLAEEAQDIPVNRQERDITPAQPKPEKQLIADKPEYPAAHFEANFTQWAAAIEAGKMNAEQLITKIESKGTLTDSQKAAIRNIEQGEAA